MKHHRVNAVRRVVFLLQRPKRIEERQCVKEHLENEYSVSAPQQDQRAHKWIQKIVVDFPVIAVPVFMEERPPLQPPARHLHVGKKIGLVTLVFESSDL